MFKERHAQRQIVALCHKAREGGRWPVSDKIADLERLDRMQAVESNGRAGARIPHQARRLVEERENADDQRHQVDRHQVTEASHSETLRRSSHAKCWVWV